MKVPYGWLKEWVPGLPDAATTALKFSGAGLGVASLVPWRPDLEGVVVGEIVEAARHPNADRLRLCTVDAGGGERLSIVCGAPNARAGLKAPLARLGARLPGGKVIGAATIRGVASQGMLCSAAELGKGSDQAGLLELEDTAVTGAPFIPDPLDWVFDLEVTPNRGDCLSVQGVARQLAAVLGQELVVPFAAATGAGAPALARAYPGTPGPGDAGWTVAITDPDACGLYTAILLEGITVGPSPDWLRARLAACGMRPINNVVDVTNYVLLELGQPLHAFDAARVAGKAITVRRARAGETMKTLDGMDRALSPEVLVIADGSGAVAAAGVMGGASSEITAATTAVLLESAWFDPARVRRGSRVLGLKSESSYRFERGVDPGGVARSSLRAAELLAGCAGGKPASTLLLARGRLPAVQPITVDAKAVSSLLGVEISVDRLKEFMGRLGASVGAPDGDRLLVVPPTWRPDLMLPADLAEEAAILYGYDRIPATRPVRDAAPVVVTQSDRVLRSIREVLRAAGFFEAQTFSLIRADEAGRLGLPAGDARATFVRLENPLNEDQAVLRSTLLPGLLRSAGYNLAREAPAVRLFEAGGIFGAAGDEPGRLALVAGGALRQTPWSAERPLDLGDILAAVEAIGDVVGVPVSARSGEAPPFAPGTGALLECGSRRVGSAGRLPPAVADAYGLPSGAWAAELDLDALVELAGLDYRVVAPPEHFAARRDLAVVVAEGVEAGAVVRAAREAGGSLVSAVEVFDVYRGKPVPGGSKSIALRLAFRAPGRSPTEADVEQAVTHILAALAAQFQAVLRG